MHYHHMLRSKAYHIFQECKKYKTIIKQFCVSFFASFLSRGITLFFTPITMQLLSPHDYGMLALANSFVSTLSIILGLGIRQALPLFYFENTSEKRSEMVQRVVCFYTLYATPVALFLLYTCNSINQMLFSGKAPQLLLVISIGISFIYFFVELIYQLLQYQQNTWPLAKLQTASTLMTIASNLFFLCILKWGVISIFAGQSIGMICICIIFFFKHKPTQMRANSIQNIFKQGLTFIRYGTPFIPSMLFSTLLTSGDRWVLASKLSMHHVGIYSVASSVTQLVNMLIMYAFTSSYMPHMLQKFHNEDPLLTEKKNKQIMCTCMVTAGVLFAAGFGSIRMLSRAIIPATFHEATNYMGVLLIGSIFYMGNHFLNLLLQHKKKSLFLGSIVCIPALFNLMVSLLLVPCYGIYGCVLATVIAHAMHFCATFLYNSHLSRQLVLK